MTPRDALTLALRIVGFWSLISAISAMAQIVSMIAAGTSQIREFGAAVGFSVLANSSLAAALLLAAPGIAAWFDRRPSPSRPPTASCLHVFDAYVIAARVLGLYALIRVIEPASLLVWRFSRSASEVVASGPLGTSDGIKLAAHLAAAALLILGAGPIARLFSTAHDAPPSTPDKPASPWDEPAESA